jgi:hypothetical protein
VAKGERYPVDVKLKITSAGPGQDGRVQVQDERDTEAGNNTATLTVSITGGGLPVTGMNTALAAGLGLCIERRRHRAMLGR